MRVAHRVVGVDLQHAHAAVGVVARDVLDALVPRQRVRAVVAGEDDDRGARAVDVQRRGRSVGVGQREGEGHPIQPTLRAVRVLTREELTAALAARQFLIERRRIPAAEAIRRLTPLQGQHPPAPHIALAARLEGFTQADLNAALDARTVVKTSIMRMTLHLAAAEDFPAYAQLARQRRVRTWRTTYPRLDQERATRDLARLAVDAADEPEIRARVGELRRRAGRPEHADPGGPDAGSARPAPARRPLGRHDPRLAPSCSIRVRFPTPPTPPRSS